MLLVSSAVYLHDSADCIGSLQVLRNSVFKTQRGQFSWLYQTALRLEL